MSPALSIRPMIPTDEATVVAMCAAACTFDLHAAPLFDALVRKKPNVTVAVVDDRTVGACITSTSTSPASVAGSLAGSNDVTPLIGFVDLLVVDPSAHGHGVGSALLTRAEDDLAAVGCSRVHFEGNPPLYAWPGVDVRYLRSIALAERRGYRRLGVEFTMRVDLTAMPPRPLAADRHLRSLGVEMRLARPRDDATLIASLAADWKPSWLYELDAALATPSGGVTVALRKDRCVGFCGFGGNRPNDVGPLGTDEQWRGHGIGTALIRQALQTLATDGHRTAQLAWAGPVGLFARTLDASIDRVFVRYGKQLR